MTDDNVHIVEEVKVEEVMAEKVVADQAKTTNIIKPTTNNRASSIFNKFIEAKPLFKERKALSLSFTPDEIPHRDNEVDAVSRVLAPCLKGGKPSNLFVYGKTGTGKTVVCNFVGRELEKAASDIRVIYVNCKMKKVADTEYRLLAYLISAFGKKVPFTGLPTDKLYHDFFEIVDKKEQTIVLVLDEIDTLIKKNGDEILYILTRANQDLKKAKLSIIGITNDLGFINKLDPRVRSSLGEEELVFPPYNAMQLQDILRKRADVAFIENGVEMGVVEKCSAYAAQEHGDARRALDLLRVAGELAERQGLTSIGVDQVDQAEAKLDKDRIVEIVKSQPRQSQAILYAILQCSIDGQRSLRGKKLPYIQTADVWDKYQKICNEFGLKSLTQRRVSDLIAEYDLFGIINTKVISRGRYGRTRMIELTLDDDMKKKVLSTLGGFF
jgi:archaeal cell division control protein 6